MIKIQLTGVLVQDQDHALEFYTEKLGFKKQTEIPLGEYRWLTVVSPAGAEGVELVLEPMGFEAAKTWQAALYKAGIPITAFAVDDIDAEHQRLQALGVVFKAPPDKPAGMPATAMFDDTCGNWIQLYEA